MTTACGSTTSSQDTPSTVSLEEAPFWKYLEILRKEGYEEDANASELFYVEMLTEFNYNKEQIMNTSFKNLVIMMEKILNTISDEIKQAPIQHTPINGNIMKGEGADKLTEEQLNRLLIRQMQLHEEEKLRQGM